MILHINTNYIYNVFHATMVETMSDPAKHVVFSPVLHNPKHVQWKATDHPAPPTVHVVPCFDPLDRLFYRRKRDKMYRALEQTVDLSTVDLIHAYTLFTDGDLAYRVHRKTGAPYVCAVRNSDVNTFFRKMPHLRRHGIEILRHASAIFFLSPVYREQVFNMWVPAHERSVFQQKTRILPNGIDEFWHQNISPASVDAARKIRREQGPVGLLCVGVVNRNKNSMAIQKARALLDAEGVQTTLTLVGRVADQKLLDQLLETPGTTYFPPEPKETLIQHYREADLFVMPSLTETFGLVYAEALSQGLPVIYTKGQGFDGQFPEGVIGRSVVPTDPVSIAEAIRSILRDPLIATRARGAANRFRWREIDEEYEMLYRAILNQTPIDQKAPEAKDREQE